VGKQPALHPVGRPPFGLLSPITVSAAYSPLDPTGRWFPQIPARPFSPSCQWRPRFPDGPGRIFIPRGFEVEEFLFKPKGPPTLCQPSHPLLCTPYQFSWRVSIEDPSAAGPIFPVSSFFFSVHWLTFGSFRCSELSRGVWPRERCCPRTFPTPHLSVLRSVFPGCRRRLLPPCLIPLNALERGGTVVGPLDFSSRFFSVRPPNPRRGHPAPSPASWVGGLRFLLWSTIGRIWQPFPPGRSRGPPQRPEFPPLSIDMPGSFFAQELSARGPSSGVVDSPRVYPVCAPPVCLSPLTARDSPARLLPAVSRLPAFPYLYFPCPGFRGATTPSPLGRVFGKLRRWVFREPALPSPCFPLGMAFRRGRRSGKGGILYCLSPVFGLADPERSLVAQVAGFS